MRIETPLTDEVIARLRAGDRVTISGTFYVARDAAHKRFMEALERNEALPFDPRGQIIYYMGPSPPPPGKPIGSAGPTTSSRMDPYTPRLLAEGLKGTIGKGARSEAVREALREFGAVYFAATGGAGALIAKRIKQAEVIAYEELGPEAVWRLEVEDFPAIVINDIYGGDAYEEGKAKYRTARESSLIKGVGKMKYRVIDLSPKLVPGKEERRLEIRSYIYEPDNTTMCEIDMMTHIGVHVEGPSHHHRLPSPKDISQVAIDTFLGEGMVLHLEFTKPNQPITPQLLEEVSGGEVQQGDILFFTSKSPPGASPYISPEASRWILERGVKMIGLDHTVGLEPPGLMTSHDTLLGNDIPIVERLTNLEKVKAKRVFIIALPLFIEGLDSSPVRAVALEKEE